MKLIHILLVLVACALYTADATVLLFLKKKFVKALGTKSGGSLSLKQPVATQQVTYIRPQPIQVYAPPPAPAPIILPTLPPVKLPTLPSFQLPKLTPISIPYPKFTPVVKPISIPVPKLTPVARPVSIPVPKLTPVIAPVPVPVLQPQVLHVQAAPVYQQPLPVSQDTTKGGLHDRLVEFGAAVLSKIPEESPIAAVGALPLEANKHY